MSRSYRYNADEEAVSNRPSWERSDEGRSLGEVWPNEEEAWEKPKRKPLKAKKPAGAQPASREAWAVERMKKRVSRVVDGLVADGAIAANEREDFTSIINAHICRVLPCYDPDLVSEDGEKCSLVHYLRVAVDYVACNIRKMSQRHKRKGVACPIAAEGEEADGSAGRVAVDDVRLSDGCRSIRDLVFRMDVRTLFEMLLPEERLCVKMRLDGYSNTEIADEISRRFKVTIDRLHVERTLLKHIQGKARKCGFFPPSEARRG